MKRIAVLTSGGDAPGMNAAIRAATRTAIERGAEAFGVRNGYEGLIHGDLVSLSARSVGGIIELGGTMLGSARSPRFMTEKGLAEAIDSLRQWAIDGVIVIGGNGSQKGALALSKAGIAVNGVASTIDNDLCGSEMCIGVDTALNITLEAIDRLRTTATSHHRVFIVEVMGRDCGYLALMAGLAGGAEVIVTPEFPLPPEEVLEQIHEAKKRHKRHAMVIVSEHAPHDARCLYNCLVEDKDACFDPRMTVLGHVVRSGRPSAFDRILATRLASRAVDLLLAGKSGRLIGLNDANATATPLEEIVGKRKELPAELLALAETMKL
jgi:6-phosphofructokinase 1